MSYELKTLWQGERARRLATVGVGGLKPSDERAKLQLGILEALDEQDIEQSNGDAQPMTVEELWDTVPETPTLAPMATISLSSRISKSRRSGA
jgi:hypothetical protein